MSYLSYSGLSPEAEFKFHKQRMEEKIRNSTSGWTASLLSKFTCKYLLYLSPLYMILIQEIHVFELGI